MKWALVGVLGVLLFTAGLWMGSQEQQIIEVPQKQEPIATPTIKLSPPHDRIAEDKIHVYSDKVVLEIPNAKWARFAPTGSMEPVLNEGSNAIQGTPSSPVDIHIGDIISYDDGQDIVIHRVIETGKDKEGWYAVVKGDNNPVVDKEKVRFEQISSVVLAIVY